MLRTRKHAGCHRSTLGWMLLVASLIFVVSASPVWAQNNRSVKVMTQNMDAGTDLKLVFAFLPDVAKGATYTYAELLQNDIPGRAAKLAEEIAAKKPDIISMQEVTLWRTGIWGSAPTDILFDQLALLLAALSERKESYYVVTSQQLSDIMAPMDLTYIGLPPDPQLSAIRFTDRDVILARTDLQKSHITLSNPQGDLYTATLNFGPLGMPIDALRGWLSVDVSIGDTMLRFFSTHLESTYPGTDGFDLWARFIQESQASELAALANSAQIPVVLAGDFNANAVPNGFENTATTGILSSAGFTEVWNALHPDGTGFTWPLYLEDPQAPNPAGPFERIDLIYQRGLEMTNIERIVRQSYPFASDHAGVVATLRVVK
jgi:endonuclease/exonuclease/phosphatase family metal-dependent hydrolase